MQQHDYFYREGIKAGANKSLIKQIDWLVKHKYLPFKESSELVNFVMSHVLPNESQESATKYFDYDEVFTMGKEKGEELACFLATRFLANKGRLNKMAKEKQVEFLQIANSKLEKSKAYSMVYGIEGDR